MRSSIGLAVSFLRVAAAFQLVDGAQVIGAGMLRGLHDTRWPLLFALVGYWVVGLGIGAWLAFAADWKGVGIWVGLASGLAAVARPDARALADARPSRPDPARDTPEQKARSPPLTDERPHNHMRRIAGTLVGRVPTAMFNLEEEGFKTHGFQAAS